MYEVDIALICAQVCDNYSKVYSNLKFDFDEDENMSIFGRENGFIEVYLIFWIMQ